MKRFYTRFLLPFLFILVKVQASIDKRVSAAQCPDGYVRHQDSCYTFHHELLSWPESITFCKALDSHLVRIESISEFNFLKSHALLIQANHTGAGYWIAATDAIKEGTWKWISPLAPMTHDQVTWQIGEPSHGSREDCALLWRPFKYLVGDYYCEQKLHMICEFEILPDFTQPGLG